MDISELDQMLFLLLSQFNIPFNKTKDGNGAVYTVDKFGTKIIFVDGQAIDTKLTKDWNVAYIYPDFKMEITRQKIIWSLVRGGYFHYLRTNFKNTFNQMFNSQGWDKMIIDYRRKIYNKAPKYNYLKELNEDGATASSSYILSMDSGFYDWIIE